MTGLAAAMGDVMPDAIPDAPTDRVDVLIEDPRWDAAGLTPLVRAAIGQTLSHLSLEAGRLEVSVMGCDDDRISTLNAEFRAKAQPTNVLSWPAHDLGAPNAGAAPLPLPPPDPGLACAELGDIAIAFDTCTREAAAQNIPFQDHVSHLLVHGCLHLLGYDHILDKDAALMERLEVEILAGLGIADPY